MIIAMSAATCAAAILTASRVFGFKRLVRHATATDVAFSIGAVVVLGSTLTGALVAILSGLMMAVVLSTCKVVAGYASAFKNPLAKEPIDDEHDAHGNWVYNQAPYI